MTVTLTSPVTGTAATGFTTPSYTVVQDSAVDSNAKRWIVTAISGTGTSGVRAHSVSDEFSFTVVKPRMMKILQAFSSLLPQAFKPAYNRYWLIFKKGGIPASGLPAFPIILRCPLDVPAGVDSNDADDLRALISFAGGCYTQISAGFGDTTVNGAL
jgi:hypothetical protein